MERYKYIVGGERSELVESYVSSIDFDEKLAKYVAMVMLSHVKTLADKKLISADAANTIIRELVKIIETDGRHLYEWVRSKGEKYEDIFEALEIFLYSVAGSDAGRIALGRSRNDHIAAVLRLAIRDKILKLLRMLLEVRSILIDKSRKYIGVVFPFFTHAQVAQCGSASIYFLTYEQTFSDLWRMLLNSIELLNQNPLGSGASSGAAVQIDVSRVSAELCLKPEPIPPYYATGSRLFMLYVASVIAMMMAEVGRFVEDFMLLSNVIPHGLLIPRTHISTSSIMPHKRNLVTLEIARAKVSKTLGLLAAILSVYKSVPYGYNLDFQEMNAYLFDMIEETEKTMMVIKDFIESTELNSEAIAKYISGKFCWSSDVIEYIAIHTNKPVRELYIELARALQVYTSGDTNALSNFLGKYGVDDVWSVVKQKPVEIMLGDLIKYFESRLMEDIKRVDMLDRELTVCNEMLISGAQQR